MFVEMGICFFEHWQNIVYNVIGACKITISEIKIPAKLCFNYSPLLVSGAKYIVSNNALIVNKPNKNDSNSYTCEAQNYLGHDSATFKVEVQCKCI